MLSADKRFAIMVPTIYGPMLVNRHDTMRGRHLIDHARPHDHGEIANLASCLRIRGGQGVVLDVGSNIGTHSLVFAAAVGPHRQVHAFEAQRMVFYMLAGNVALSGLTNIYCHNLAVSDREGSIKIPDVHYRTTQNFGAVSFKELERRSGDAGPAARTHSVPTVSIDSLGFEDVALIKIDVEGMEREVLEGARETIRRARPIIYAEFHLVDREALKTEIESWDYKVYAENINFLCIPNEYAHQFAVNEGRGG